MKLPLPVFATLLLATLPGHADWVVEQKTTTEGKTQTTKLLLKDAKIRMNQGEEMTLIFTGEDRRILMVMHDKKIVMKLSPEKLKSMMAVTAESLGGDEGAVEKPEATGRREKIGDYDCEVYTWSGKMGTGKFWVTKEFKGYEEINAASDKLLQAVGSPVAALAPKSSDFPGMVIKSEMKVMGQDVITELVSAKEEPVPDGAFAPPDDYEEMSLPVIRGK